MTTYEGVHAGDVVLGHDGELWGVEQITHAPQLAVTLVKGGGEHRITGYPPAGTEVTVFQRADVSSELLAAQALIDAGLGPLELLSERWEMS